MDLKQLFAAPPRSADIKIVSGKLNRGDQKGWFQGELLTSSPKTV